MDRGMFEEITDDGGMTVSGKEDEGRVKRMMDGLKDGGM